MASNASTQFHTVHAVHSLLFLLATLFSQNVPVQSNVVLLFYIRGKSLLDVMSYKKIPKNALLITLLILCIIRENIHFLGGGRPTVTQEAIQVMSNT